MSTAPDLAIMVLYRRYRFPVAWWSFQATWGDQGGTCELGLDPAERPRLLQGTMGNPVGHTVVTVSLRPGAIVCAFRRLLEHSHRDVQPTCGRHHSAPGLGQGLDPR